MFRTSFSILLPQLCFNNIKLFHLDVTLQSNRQLTNTFMKMATKFEGKKKKNRPFISPNVSQPEQSMKSIVQNNRSKFIRREKVLNKLFMSHITDFMSSGNISADLIGRGIEITSVRISSNFQCLNVFWTSKGLEQDEELQKVLDEYAFIARDTLSQLKVVGNVPKMYFIKDKYRSRLSEVDSILSKADYGEDFTPVYPTLLNDEYLTPIDPESIESMALDNQNIMPPMRNDVFNLDRDAIMKDVEKVIKKSKALHRITNGQITALLNPNFEDVKNLEVPKDDQEDLLSYKEYLRQQKILKSKMREELEALYKQEANDNPEIRMNDEEEYSDEFSDDEYDYDESDKRV